MRLMSTVLEPLRWTSYPSHESECDAREPPLGASELPHFGHLDLSLPSRGETRMYTCPHSHVYDRCHKAGHGRTAGVRMNSNINIAVIGQTLTLRNRHISQARDCGRTDSCFPGASFAILEQRLR